MHYTANSLVALNTSIRLAVLAQTVVLGWLVISATGGATTVGRSTSSAGLSTLNTCLVGVDLAVGELCRVLETNDSVVKDWDLIPPVPTRLSGVPSCLRPPCSVPGVSGWSR